MLPGNVCDLPWNMLQVLSFLPLDSSTAFSGHIGRVKETVASIRASSPRKLVVR